YYMSGQYSVLTIFQLSLKVSILTEPYSVMHPIIDHTSLLIAPHLGVLSPDEVLQQFSLDDRLKGISLEEIQQYLKNKQGEKDN
ncbi:hypothetical protein, partial [Candidatus Electrothrix sp.]|uniref:hypothetical protein n=2 Tax=Candidatus Electrothrix sp. TaxID=2170559 RepID=UPI004057259C